MQMCVCVCVSMRVFCVYLIWAQEGPAELPGLRRDLSLHEPFLGQVLVFYIGIVVQLVEGLEMKKKK